MRHERSGVVYRGLRGSALSTGARLQEGRAETATGTGSVRLIVADLRQPVPKPMDKISLREVGQAEPVPRVLQDVVWDRTGETVLLMYEQKYG